VLVLHACCYCVWFGLRWIACCCCLVGISVLGWFCLLVFCFGWNFGGVLVLLVVVVVVVVVVVLFNNCCIRVVVVWVC